MKNGDGIGHPLFGVFLNFLLVSVVDEDGLKKSVSLCICQVLPTGGVPVVSALPPCCMMTY